MPTDAPAARPDDRTRGPVATPGMVLGDKYRLEEAIARGGMARVWRARHIELNRPVAVKFVDGAGAGASGIERFLVEAKVAASVRHKNVVDILDFGFVEQPGRDAEPYMVMELLEGETLADRIERSPLGDDESIDITLQLLSGLDAVHRAGIIHRDLKPGNIFLTHDHDGTFARLLDFGISEGVEQRTPSEAGQVVGTPEYMSPEQAFGTAIDLRADLYGVGVMLYEMLGAGRLPFEHDDAHRVLEMVVAGEHQPLVALRPHLTDLSAVVERALARNPDDRYKNARDMRRAIVEASGSGDTTTERMAAIRESGTRRRPQAVTAPELVAPSQHPEARAASSRSIARLAIVGVVAIAAVAGGVWAVTSREAAPVASEPRIEEPSAAVSSPPVETAAPVLEAVPEIAEPNEPATETVTEAEAETEAPIADEIPSTGEGESAAAIETDEGAIASRRRVRGRRSTAASAETEAAAPPRPPIRPRRRSRSRLLIHRGGDARVTDDPEGINGDPFRVRACSGSCVPLSTPAMNAAERTAPLDEPTSTDEATERELVTESHVGQVSAPSETTEGERVTSGELVRRPRAGAGPARERQGTSSEPTQLPTGVLASGDPQRSGLGPRERRGARGGEPTQLIQHQLQQLKQRESELRRELAIAEHPDLADAIRQIEGRAYGVGRVETKMAEGLSKSELRKKETLEKKLLSAMEKRVELDQQIASLEAELAPLGEARTVAFQKERGEALLRLAGLLDEHAEPIENAALDLDALIPALPAWREEIAVLRSQE